MAKKYSPIAVDHHIVRHCGFQRVEREPGTNRVLGLHLRAMALRPEIREPYLSVNWLEHCEGTKIERLRVVVETIRQKTKSKYLSPQSGVAVLKCGKVVEIGSDFDRKLSVLYAPSKTDPSYSRINGLPLDNEDLLLLSALAEEAFKDFTLLADLGA